ncbi:hypothetical protein Nmel_000152 [Mimus melanotis]
MIVVKKLQKGNKWKTNTCQTWSASSSLLILFLCKVRYEYLLFEYASGCTEPPWLVLPSQLHDWLNHVNWLLLCYRVLGSSLVVLSSPWKESLEKSVLFIFLEKMFFFPSA